MKRLAQWSLCLFALLIFSILVPQTMSAQVVSESDDLQAMLDGLADSQKTRSSEPTIIDLSTFSSTTRSTTLYVRDGINVKFINGTLSRTEKLDGPILAVIDGSTADLGEDMFIDGKYYILGHELVNVKESTLKVSGGIITGIYDSTRAISNDILADKYVILDSPSEFYMSSGDPGEVICEEGVNAEVSGGCLKLRNFQ